MADNDELLAEAQECFRLCEEREAENRMAALDDLRFARLGEQWPAEIRRKREEEGRPCLTINRLPAFIRQVVNDARQNKPQIKCHPADSAADVETAEILNGLIRNIEATSKADVAYDTAIESAVTMGFGYFRINTGYSDNDSFELDLRVEAVPNPFSVWGDPWSTSSDSADWNECFVAETLPREAFERRWKDAQAVDWSGGGYGDLASPWMEGESVRVAEWWRREAAEKTLLMLSNQEVVDAEVYALRKAELDALGVIVAGERRVRGHKVKQYLITGAEVLEERAWAGRHIPIVPVWGEEVNVEGRRHLRSLVRDAKDPQRMFNYWRTTSTELVALAPKAPFIGPRGAFTTDAAKWASANTESWAFIEYDGAVPPERQPFAGVPAGALQEAMNAADDLKAVMGLFDASLGAQGNETSGTAILARAREGDTSTFHFIDNLSRAVEHGGRILVDLIPHVYSGARMVRVLGPEGERLPPVQLQPSPAGAGFGSQGQGPMMQPRPGAAPGPDGWNPADLVRVYDLSAGKYDLTVETGPSFTTRREEAARQMIELIRVNPQVAAVIGDLLAKNLDWPGAEEIARRLQALLPDAARGVDPRVQQLTQTLQAGKQQYDQQLAALQDQLRQAEAAAMDMQVRLDAKSGELAVRQRQVQIDAYRAETERAKALGTASAPAEEQPPNGAGAAF